MTTALDNFESILYQTNSTDDYNGVLRVSTGTSYGTGSLLYDGKTIITAAHLFDFNDYDNKFIYIGDGEINEKQRVSVNIYDYADSVNVNGDFALITLSKPLDYDYNRYDLYRNSDDIGKSFIMVGYGDNGTGTLGSNDSELGIKLKTYNTFDAQMYDIYESDPNSITWIPELDSTLIADFDNGLTQNDAIGFLLGIDDLGVGDREGLIAPGDSGGPAFIDGKIAGIASYTTSFSTTDYSPDVNDIVDSSFGEIAVWERMSYYQEWIDKTIRNGYENAPTSKDEVLLTVTESDIKTTYVYFYVEYKLDRNIVNDIISVDYKTVDGTAIAGSDYVETKGTLNLYTDESYAVIPVEIIPDNIVEDDEYFYLEISNPINASFGNSVTLTAMRTIIDDDGNLYI